MAKRKGLHHHGLIAASCVLIFAGMNVLDRRLRLKNDTLHGLVRLLPCGDQQLLLEEYRVVWLRGWLLEGDFPLGLKLLDVRLPEGVQDSPLVSEGCHNGTLQVVGTSARQAVDRNDRPEGHEGSQEEDTVVDLCQLDPPDEHRVHAKAGNDDAHSEGNPIRLPINRVDAEHRDLLVLPEPIQQERAHEYLDAKENQDGSLADPSQQEVGEPCDPPRRGKP
mmetsp:Transcript_17525/g.39541  ORF Transcript_17525/g.39541 Transcript_17525/m.39541 type:complete len:221 (-) Transcript_17525:41-703(-)